MEPGPSTAFLYEDQTVYSGPGREGGGACLSLKQISITLNITKQCHVKKKLQSLSNIR